MMQKSEIDDDGSHSEELSALGEADGIVAVF